MSENCFFPEACESHLVQHASQRAVGSLRGYGVPALPWSCCRPLALSGPPFLHSQLKGLQEISMEDPFSLAPAI